MCEKEREIYRERDREKERERCRSECTLVGVGLKCICSYSYSTHGAYRVYLAMQLLIVFHSCRPVQETCPDRSSSCVLLPAPASVRALRTLYQVEHQTVLPVQETQHHE